MTIPTFQDVMLPILTTTSEGSVHSWRHLRDECARLFQATEQELTERVPSGSSRFDGRVQWAITHMAQAGLLIRPQRGQVQITSRGKDVLSERPDRVDMQLLNRFEEYRNFRSRSRETQAEPLNAVGADSEESTPLEAIAEAVRRATMPWRARSSSG